MFLTEYGKVIGIIIATIIILALVGVGLRFMQVTTDRAIIEQSKSYIDSRNEKAGILILEYEKASESQKKLIEAQVCDIYDELGQQKSDKVLNRFASQNCN